MNDIFLTFVTISQLDASFSQVLTLRLRFSSKIVRATVSKHPTHDEDLVDSNKKVLKVLCYDTTSWVKVTIRMTISLCTRG